MTGRACVWAFEQQLASLDYSPTSSNTRSIACPSHTMSRTFKSRLDSLTRLSESGSDLPPPRALNFELAAWVAFTPCTNVKELIFGRNSENQATFDSYRAAAVRFPSETAYFDMLQRNADEGPYTWSGYSSPGLLLRIVYGASNLAGKLSGNPRLGTCASMNTASW